MNNQVEEKTDNELIAEFMGLTISKKYGLEVEMPPDNPSAKGYLITPKYDTSWDWLMPVIEKISQHVYDSQEEDDGTGNKRIIEYRAYPRTFGMISTEGKWLFRFNRMPLEEGDTLIEAAYKAVVEYIKAPK